MSHDDAVKSGSIVLPPLPEVLAELLSMLGRDELHGADIARTVSRDPALAAATLKLANSPFFGLARRVANMQDAITLIGVNAVRNMLLILGMRSALRPPEDLFDSHGFWLHALETASAARALMHANSRQADEAFLAGVMHDLGKLVNACVHPDLLEQVTQTVRRYGCSWYEAEQAVGVMGHEETGAKLAEAWQLPEALACAMSHHHSPSADDPPVVHAVHIANLIGHAAQGVSEGEPAPPLSLVSWQRLTPSEADIERAVRAVRLLHSHGGEWRALLMET